LEEVIMMASHSKQILKLTPEFYAKGGGVIEGEYALFNVKALAP